MISRLEIRWPPRRLVQNDRHAPLLSADRLGHVLESNLRRNSARMTFVWEPSNTNHATDNHYRIAGPWRICSSRPGSRAIGSSHGVSSNRARNRSRRETAGCRRRTDRRPLTCLCDGLPGNSRQPNLKSTSAGSRSHAAGQQPASNLPKRRCQPCVCRVQCCAPDRVFVGSRAATGAAFAPRNLARSRSLARLA